ncbi:ATP-dependent DNA helicase [Prochlorococcus sp. MIT 1341]|uniref:ATP-dependent DNA helicase n=1 Tax=Prochlorococcus sp. MIT 1341 TaxID=3096221 RepID=UPI002A75C5A1|nr:AAA family ATPase [Prochlorococcus sp. MIT 1341]
MSLFDFDSWSPRLASATYKLLLKRLPPKVRSSHLEDIVDVLIYSLSNGELFFDLTSDYPNCELRQPGWPETHLKALRESGWIDGDLAPIVLSKSRLSWNRCHEDLKVVLDELLRRSQGSKKLSSEILSIDFDLPSGLNEEQARAVAAIDDHGLLLISGGPGTGKTSTIVQIIARAITLRPDSKVVVSAPTGKAARRLQESMQKNIERLDSLQREKLYKLPCITLHRLLEASSEGFRRNKRNPLAIDLLIVDEMSMVDLSLMSVLLMALPSKCQLVLVGDPDQLPPVGGGSIWHLLQSEAFKNYHDCSVHFHHVYRNKGALSYLSNLLRKEGLSSFWKGIIDSSQSSNFSLHNSQLNGIPSHLSSQLEAYSYQLSKLSGELVAKQFKHDIPTIITRPDTLTIASQLFDVLDEYMVLCPRRSGVWGIDHVHQSFLGKKFGLGVMYWPQGFPVMCCENQPEIALANGDIGLVIGDGKRRRILFRVSIDEVGGSIILINPSRIKALEPAMALTIHKSQGSEAKNVFVLWPEEFQVAQSQINTSKNTNQEYEMRLLYTAITRASDHVDLFMPIGKDG